MVPPQLVHPMSQRARKPLPRRLDVRRSRSVCRQSVVRLRSVDFQISAIGLVNIALPNCLLPPCAGEYDAIYTWTITKHTTSDVKLSSVWLCSSSEFRLSTPSVSVPFSLGALSLAASLSLAREHLTGFPVDAKRCDGLVSCSYNIFYLIWDSCLYQTNPNAGVMLTQSGHLVILA